MSDLHEGIYTFMDCPYYTPNVNPSLQAICRHNKGCYNGCESNIDSGSCPRGYAR